MGEGSQRRKTLIIAVRDFAMPLRRSGDLRLGDALPLDLGQEIHERIQTRLESETPGYWKEYALKHGWRVSPLILKLQGRCDGYIPGETPCLEEIKSSYSLETLKKELGQNPEHPYILQAQTYAWIHYLRTDQIPELRLRLVCSWTLKEELWPLNFDPEAFTLWTQKRSQQILGEWQQRSRLRKTRERLSQKIAFPFAAPRAQQVELIEAVRERVDEGRGLLLQAPTGLGKTAGVLVPALKSAWQRGAPVVFLAPKNSQFEAAIDLAAQLRKQGVRLKTLVLQARSKVCRLETVSCASCPYGLAYHDKVGEKNLEARDSRRHLWDARYFYKISEQHECCPYELAMERIPEADLIICDYNYVFGPHASFLDRYLHPYLPSEKPVLVVDEAHNLPGRVMDAYSPELRLSQLKVFALSARAQESAPFASLVSEAEELLQKLRPPARLGRIELPRENVETLLGTALEMIQAEWLAGRLPELEDPLMQFYLLWRQLDDIQQLPEIELPILYKEESGDPLIKAHCVDPSPFLGPIYGSFYSQILFSATLKPFEFYLSLLGLDPAKTDTVEFSSPFPRANKCIMLIPQIETNYRERDRHYPRIASVIERVSRQEPGPYLIFFPSYAFLRAVERELDELGPRSRIVSQKESLSGSSVRQLMAQIQSASEEHRQLLFLAVQGGSMAEGIDYRGLGLRGAFIVGPAIPQASYERQLMQEHYDKIYGEGRAYAYIYPAMAKSIQAAGRVVRDEDERAAIFLLDSRFLQNDYARCMPADWYETSPKELVPARILSELEAFWQKGESDENRTTESEAASLQSPF